MYINHLYHKPQAIPLFSSLYLWYTVDIGDNFDNVVQWQQRVAFQLSVDVLALGAGSQ